VKPGARWAIAIGLIVAMGVSLVVGGNEWETTTTSYGSIPAGYGATYQLLTELSLSRGRSFAEASGLADGATVWWIAPHELCDGAEAGDLEGATSGIWHSLDWIESGGTAVVFLPDRVQPCLEEIELAGLPLLPLRSSELDLKDEPEASAVRVVSGSIHPEPRGLGEIPLQFFEWREGFDVLSEDPQGRPFVVSRSLGAGRLVLVATAQPLTNQWLDHWDASLFVVDLARALGPPLIDEREHGLLPAPSAIPYLLESSALPALAGTLLLALLAVWWGRATPASGIEQDVAPPPSLEGFVASIATLYAGTRDHQEALRAYQEFALSQLRRAYRLAPDASTESVCERALASKDLADADLAPLREPAPIKGSAALLAEVARIDALVAKLAV
jgi:hypothetical protein